MKVCPKFPCKVLPPCQSHSNLTFVQLWFICFSSWTYLLVRINRYWSPPLKPILLATFSLILNLSRCWFGALLMLDFNSRKPRWYLTTENTEIKEVMYKKRKYEKLTSLTRQEVKLLLPRTFYSQLSLCSLPPMNSKIYSISQFYKIAKCLTFLAHD